MTGRRLPRARPSEQGVEAAGVLAFLDAVDRRKIDLHSLMVVRHGAVVAEGWWAPYTSDRVHLLYSLSKSFVSTAVGMAEAEGLLSVDDPVLDHFPDEAPPHPSPNLRALRVRHLLAMASGHREDTRTRLQAGGEDWVRSFLALPPEEEPGTLFTYNQGCTHTLAALVCRRTGASLLDYLRPRLFDPLGIDQALWTLAPDGIEQGWSGLHLVTESVAELGQLFLQQGRWGDRQLLPEAYVDAATRTQVDNRRRNTNPDWQQGYGFQFWRCRHGAYRGDGAFGQFCVVLPDRDAVVAITAQTAEMQQELDLVWKHLLPAMDDGARADADAEARLADRLRHLATPRVEGAVRGAAGGVTFAPEGDTSGLGALRVDPDPAGIRLSVATAAGQLSTVAGAGPWAEGELAGVNGLHPAVAVAAGWTSDRELRVDIVFLTSPHRLQLRARTGPDPRYTLTWVQAPL